MTGGFDITNSGQAGTLTASPTVNPNQPRLGNAPGLHEARVPFGFLLDNLLATKNFGDMGNAFSSPWSAFVGPNTIGMQDQVQPQVGTEVSGEGQPPGDWWERPGVVFDDQDNAFVKGAPLEGAGVPEWAGGGFDTAQQFYEHSRTFEDPDVRRTWEANLRASYGERQTYNQNVLDPLLARSQPDYDYVTELQRSAMENQIARSVALNQAQLSADAAGRGVAGGSAHGGVMAATRAYGDLAGLQVGASIDQANQGFRNAALELYGSLGAIEPTDYFTGLDADRSSVSAQREEARADQALLEYRRAQETGLPDLLQTLFAAVGTGIYDAFLPDSDETPWSANTGLGLSGPGS